MMDALSMPPIEWAARIAASWRRSAESIIETGKLLIEAKAALEHGAWGEMIEKQLPFGARTAQRLMAIAQDERLQKTTLASLLPPDWTAMYELTRLKTETIDEKVADGTINPEMSRRDLATNVKRERRTNRERVLGALQQALPDKKYGVILADPEWRFEPWSRETGMDRAADNHYPTSATDVIASRDVASISADDCVLFLWATGPMIREALIVMDAWGFEYKSQVIWEKIRETGEPFLGTGYWFRNSHELLLVGVKGNVPAPAPGTQESSRLEGIVGVHSQKPEEFLQMIEDYFPTLPKIELNRRGSPRPGWDAWGLEATESINPETGEITSSQDSEAA